MASQKYKGKILNFHDLIKNQKVEIPIIQRDYAQGRKDKKEIRINFLNALLNCITSKNSIKLDFIYGSNVNNSFQPLDGQQRLTTLFLLHWYAATKDKSISKENKELLSKFSYETRITSRDFCFALVNNPIDIIKENEIISQSIIDSNWFFLSWRNDPTIDSMLRTIDDIHTLFFKVQHLWDTLTSQLNLISFYYVELENIGLTDDLYIKMNARGKLLTPFENFKASFQKHIEDEKWEGNLSFPESFALKIDTSWTDYFWHHFRKQNTIDDALMRFIASVAMIRQSIDRTITKAEERVLLITNLQEQPNSVRPEHFTKPSFTYLIQCFELYDLAFKNQVELALPFPMWRHKPRHSILSEIVCEENIYSTVQINSATYTLKVLFFAQTEYLRKVENFDKSKFDDWMRVIRNIVSRGDIDKDGNRPDIIRSPQTFDGVINLINELSEGCSDIYTYLLNLDSLKSQFAKDQIEEEKNKAKLITKSAEYKNLIFSAEDNELLRGKIEFIFYAMNYDNSVDTFNKETFAQLKEVFSKYFNSEEGLNNDLRRAMLTIDVNKNFDYYNYWWSYWHIISASKRRLLDKFRELEYYIYSDFREYFKKLVLQLIQKDLKKIAIDFIPDNNFPNWKKRLIKEPDLLDKKGKSNYIAILEDNSCCYLLKSKRPRDIEGSEKVS
jgi:Protein of unknown function DUF262